ncbi:HEAT repeat domain-containing protein [Neptunicella sp.]|uniref:HEAT repeat domain-containing protein n=1 Tax=Neptunicella sp. TaxID=2125986 RepID=UPI003F6917AC
MNQINEIFMDDIESIDDESQNSFEKLKKGVFSVDSEIRQRSFSKLACFEYSEEIKGIFERGLLDNDELIRSDCIEFLAEFDLLNNLEKICELLDDPSYYVVYSCVISLAELNSEKERVFRLLLDKLKDKSLQSGIVLRVNYTLYRLDPTYSIEHLLDCYSDSRDYRDRCAILSLLAEGAREEDIPVIKEKLDKFVNPNDFKSVLSSYDELLDSLD